MRTPFLLLLILGLIGCDNTSSLSPQPFCLESTPTEGISPIDVEGWPASCDASLPLDTSVYCSLIPEERLPLTDLAKCWLPQYQFEIGRKLFFRNEGGDIQPFTLNHKEHLLARRVNFYDPCPEDTTKFIGHCYEPELYYFILESDDTDLRLYVESASWPFRHII